MPQHDRGLRARIMVHWLQLGPVRNAITIMPFRERDREPMHHWKYNTRSPHTSIVEERSEWEDTAHFWSLPKPMSCINPRTPIVILKTVRQDDQTQDQKASQTSGRDQVTYAQARVLKDLKTYIKC